MQQFALEATFSIIVTFKVQSPVYFLRVPKLSFSWVTNELQVISLVSQLLANPISSIFLLAFEFSYQIQTF